MTSLRLQRCLSLLYGSGVHGGNFKVPGHTVEQGDVRGSICIFSLLVHRCASDAANSLKENDYHNSRLRP